MAPTERGLWGGLIVLGAASTNTGVMDNPIEGVPEAENAVYGGTDDDDDSGTIRYVSIRHGGADIGADNEINGLTLGGVGRGTTIEYVEVPGQPGRRDRVVRWDRRRQVRLGGLLG